MKHHSAPSEINPCLICIAIPAKSFVSLSPYSNTSMALDNGYALPTRTLPTSADVTHETPTLDISRHSSCHGSSSPLTNSSPPPSPPGGASYRSRLQGDRDGGYIEKRSSIDSRRFTSDLDNSLIQQIHTLRLELESKNVAVDSLEERLQKSTNENKQMSEDLSVQATEARSLRKQMQLLESGTLAALGDIAKERDAAIGTMTDTRKRLELSNKKIRSQEEEAEKALAIREKEQEDWVDEKRNLERKVHVLENRLKTMVTELVATDTTAQNLAGIGFDSDDTSREALAKADAFSARSSNRPDSRMSTRSSGEYHDPRDPNIRAPSRLIALHEIVEPNLSSLSLADELEGEDEDEDSEQEEEKDDRLHTPTFPEALPEENEHRAIRYSEDQKARKMMGLASEPLESTCDKETSGQRTMGNIMDPINHTLENRMLQYTDTATQFSTPPSPTLPSQRCDSAMTHNVEQTNDITDRKRQSVEILPLSSEQAPSPTSNASKPAELVSSSCQTDETTFTTPAIIEPESVSSAGMTDSSTQTTEEQSSLQSIAARGLALSSMSVPVITIEPPASRPPSSHASVVLPPRTRNAGSQAAIEQPRDLRSISIQTDDIRIDGRPARPFPRVGSSHTSGPSSSKQTERWEQTGVPPAPRIPRRILRPPVLQNDPPPASPPISSIRDAYPGNNDNGPLDNRQQSGPRRPIRRDSIFAGFSDDDDEIADIVGDDFSDDGAVTDPPVRKTLSKVKDSWKLVPQSQSSIPNRRDIVSDTEAQVQAGSSATLTMNRPKQNRRTSENLPTKGTAPPPLKLNSSREPDIRRTALVSSGSTTHTQRQRSPSAPSSSGLVPVPPPFPVPTRSSSRKIPISASDGAGSPTPRSTSFFTSRRSRQQGRPPVKRKILRKTQSAAAVTLPPQPNRPPPPPPPLPPLPPLPPPPMELPSNPPSTPRSEPQSRNQFILPYPDELASRKQSTEPSISKSHLSEAVIEPSSQQTSVVDAIAQTMVGEWMWKYVRKRTSFGITETPQAEFENGKSETGSTGGARHKRWVWLAPYERAVIWSGKQPTSGPALLGKGGRKRKCEHDSIRVTLFLTCV